MDEIEKMDPFKIIFKDLNPSSKKSRLTIYLRSCDFTKNDLQLLIGVCHTILKETESRKRLTTLDPDGLVAKRHMVSPSGHNYYVIVPENSNIKIKSSSSPAAHTSHSMTQYEAKMSGVNKMTGGLNAAPSPVNLDLKPEHDSDRSSPALSVSSSLSTKSRDSYSRGPKAKAKSEGSKYFRRDYFTPILDAGISQKNSQTYSRKRNSSDVDTVKSDDSKNDRRSEKRRLKKLKKKLLSASVKTSEGSSSTGSKSSSVTSEPKSLLEVLDKKEAMEEFQKRLVTEEKPQVPVESVRPVEAKIRDNPFAALTKNRIKSEIEIFSSADLIKKEEEVESVKKALEESVKKGMEVLKKLNLTSQDKKVVNSTSGRLTIDKLDRDKKGNVELQKAAADSTSSKSPSVTTLFTETKVKSEPKEKPTEIFTSTSAGTSLPPKPLMQSAATSSSVKDNHPVSSCITWGGSLDITEIKQEKKRYPAESSVGSSRSKLDVSSDEVVVLETPPAKIPPVIELLEDEEDDEPLDEIQLMQKRKTEITACGPECYMMHPLTDPILPFVVTHDMLLPAPILKSRIGASKNGSKGGLHVIISENSY